MNDKKKPSIAELEMKANAILNEAPIGSRFSVPQENIRISSGIKNGLHMEYVRPKTACKVACTDCGNPISYCSAGRCKACFHNEKVDKYQSAFYWLRG